MIGITEQNSRGINIEVQLMKNNAILGYRSIVFRSIKIIPLYFVQFRFNLMY